MPIPRWVINSPSHITKAVPAVIVRTIRATRPGVVVGDQVDPVGEGPGVEEIGEAGRLDQGEDHRDVTGPLGDDLATAFALVLEGLQPRDHDREQLHDDRGGDVGKDAEGEHGELLEGTAGEQVQQAVDAAGLLLGLPDPDGIEIDAGHRQGGPQAVDREHGQREEDLPPKIGNGEHMPEHGKHGLPAL